MQKAEVRLPSSWCLIEGIYLVDKEWVTDEYQSAAMIQKMISAFANGQRYFVACVAWPTDIHLIQ